MTPSTSRILQLHAPGAAIAAGLGVLAWRFGGYHPRVWGWAALLALAWAVFEAARGRLPALRSPGGLAIGALVALSVWGFASISWAATTRHEAWEEADRTLMYAACFLLGATLLASARAYARHMTWIATMIAATGLVIIGRLAFAEFPLRAFAFGRLEAPIGYANGLAAFAAIGAFLLLGVSSAAQQRVRLARQRLEQQPYSADPPSRWEYVISGAAVAGIVVLAAVAQLAQSRGGLVAVALGCVVMLIAAPSRLAVVSRLVLIAVAIGAMYAKVSSVFPALYDVRQAPFTKGADTGTLITVATDAAHSAGMTVLVIALVAGIIGAALIAPSIRIHEWIDTRFPNGVTGSITIAVTVFVVALLVTGAVITDKSPISWMTSQVRTCSNPPTAAKADAGSAQSHFSDSGTGRCDYYRVALDNGRSQLLRGIGAGNFQNSYIADRRTDEQPEVAHSLPLQLFGELGLVGLLLGGIVVGVTVWATVRFIGSGVMRDPIFAGAIAAIFMWLAHSSIDWLWQLPAVTIPIMLAMGGLVACVSPAAGTVPARAAAPIAAGVLLLGITALLPQTLADRAFRQARDATTQRDHPKQALEAAQRASDFDPTWAAPHLSAAAALRTIGKRQEASDEVTAAVQLEPRSPLVLRQAAVVLTGIDNPQAKKLRKRAQSMDARTS